MKSAKIKHDYFVYPILRMGTIFLQKEEAEQMSILKMLICNSSFFHKQTVFSYYISYAAMRIKGGIVWVK